ncbi:MAG: hypothetical protein WDO71_22960 [Bacteroidota bacterium]
MEINKMNYATANRLINDLVNLKILEELPEFKRSRMFLFNDYLRIFMTNASYRKEE